MSKGKKSRFDRRRITEITPERLELRKSGQVLTLTRKDAIGRQVDNAIEMWFHKREPIVLHLNIMAAHEVLCGLGYDSPLKKDIGWTHWGLAYDWLKHSGKDPNDILDFPLRINEIILYDCTDAVEKIFGESTVLMDTYGLYAALHLLPEYPEIRQDAVQGLPRGLVLSEIDGLSAYDFATKVIPTIRDLKGWDG